MQRYHIEFDIEAPENVTEEEVYDWARYMVGDTGSFDEDNPLAETPFDPVFGTFNARRE
jgi:hypothetical protein